MAAVSYEECRARVRSGDLLLCSGSGWRSRLIQRATGSPYSHVALILRLPTVDRVLVLESEYPTGVRALPLSTYFHDWRGTGRPFPGHLVVARHPRVDFDHPEVLPELLSRLVDALGRPYSLGRALRMGLRQTLGLVGLRFGRLDLKRALVCSEYVAQVYSHFDLPLRWNAKGFVSPGDIAASPQLEMVCYVR